MDVCNKSLCNVDYDGWLSNQLEETYKSLRESQMSTNIILTVFLAAVFLVGTTGNITVLIVCAKTKSKQTATVFIMALAIIDLIICLLVLPGVLIKEWYVPFRWDALCRGWELVRCATIPLSTLILAVVAADRYILICQAGHLTAISISQAKWILMAVALCSLGLGIPPMLRVGVYQQGSVPGDPPEYLGLCINNGFLISKSAVSIYWEAMAAKFCLVLLILVVLYGLIFRTVHRQGAWTPSQPSELKMASNNSVSSQVELAVPPNGLDSKIHSPAENILKSSNSRLGANRLHDKHNMKGPTAQVINEVLQPKTFVEGKQVNTNFVSQLYEQLIVSSAQLTGQIDVLSSQLTDQEIPRSQTVDHYEAPISPFIEHPQLSVSYCVDQQRKPTSHVIGHKSGLSEPVAASSKVSHMNDVSSQLNYDCDIQPKDLSSSNDNIGDDLSKPMSTESKIKLTSNFQVTSHEVHNFNNPIQVIKMEKQLSPHSLKTYDQSMLQKHADEQGNIALTDESDIQVSGALCSKHEFMKKSNKVSTPNFWMSKCLHHTKVHPILQESSSTIKGQTGLQYNKRTAVSPGYSHSNEARHNRMWSAQVKTAKVLLMVTVVYVLSFAPALLMTIGAIPSHIIPFYAYFIHSATNPLIYSFTNRTFRKHLLQLIRCA